MPTDVPAPRADVMSPRRAFLMVGMSDRRGVDEEAARGSTGVAIFEEVAAPKVLASRLDFADERTTGGGVTNEVLAATAGDPLFTEAGPNPLRARRSWRVSDMPGRTDRFLERESFGAIAIREGSDPAFHETCVCGVIDPGKAEA